MVNPGSILSPQSIVYGNNGEPIILYSHGGLSFSRWNGVTWETKNIMAGSTAQEIYAIKYDNIIYCIYRNASNSIRFIRMNLDGSVVSNVSINSWNGNVNLAINESAQEILLVSNYGLRRYNIVGNTWSGDEKFDGSSGITQPSVAVSLNGTIWIAYKEIIGNNLKVAQSNGSDWNVWFVDTSTNVGDYNRIWIDNNNVAHIVYYNNTSQILQYATFKP
jgi:hypothetical protein